MDEAWECLYEIALVCRNDADDLHRGEAVVDSAGQMKRTDNAPVIVSP